MKEFSAAEKTYKLYCSIPYFCWYCKDLRCASKCKVLTIYVLYKFLTYANNSVIIRPLDHLGLPKSYFTYIVIPQSVSQLFWSRFHLYTWDIITSLEKQERPLKQRFYAGHPDSLHLPTWMPCSIISDSNQTGGREASLICPRDRKDTIRISKGKPFMWWHSVVVLSAPCVL